MKVNVLFSGILPLLVITLLICACQNQNIAQIQTIESSTTNTTSISSTETCLLTQKGYITGEIKYHNQPVSDGYQLTIVSDASFLASTNTENGRYSFPLLTQECGDDIKWFGFQIRTPSVYTYVVPTEADTIVDLEVTTDTSALWNEPACVFVLGTVRGKVIIDGQSAPDGTVVMSGLGSKPFVPADEMIEKRAGQRTFTSNGEFVLPTLGSTCGSDEPTYTEMTLMALEERVVIAPTAPEVEQDIIITTKNNN